ncbi:MULTISPECIES: hypothetical protein [Marinobacterium]|jgi:hypothetical protein|uniref:Uncharacterized protein n=1 Tax=Marinobacterium iners DSM 11526 TaxID=1122198 RepID=A0A1H4A990_9GAMM|nr:hypothetical protein [Marinobacterium iners]QSR35706.1 hypothetical protein CFI10_11960 [Marinobacterium iners]SEA32559.1 hypothetical protein SAMN02745729_102319 [Marinobacterium iners DSM 11526]
MEPYLNASDKFDLQQNYRRYLKFHDQCQVLNEILKDARASRVWVAGVVLMVFALGSEFFLGAAAGLFGLYFYRILSAWYRLSQVEENVEGIERWFASKGLKFESRVLYQRNDDQLAQPLDPFNEELYR